MNLITSNPFVVGRYISPEYFCDRIEETATLTKHLTNGRNVALISPRRIGKTGLIEHTLQQNIISNKYHTFFVDIYGSRNLNEFIYLFSKAIFDQLKPQKSKWRDKFFQIIRSLQVGVRFDQMSATPSLDLSIGDIALPYTTIDEIFAYIECADKPCIIAFDEFQQILYYPDSEKLEATLRTKIQHCKNATFIFSGSKRRMMSRIFLSANKPFYQSSITMGLKAIPLETYKSFVQKKFEEHNRTIDEDLIEKIYTLFDGTSWFIQMMMNELFSITPEGGHCKMEQYQLAFQNIILSQDMAYREMMNKIPIKQKEVLLAFARAVIAENITSAAFIKQYHLSSSSSVQSAVKVLLEEDIVTQIDGKYRVYDYFFSAWLRAKY